MERKGRNQKKDIAADKVIAFTGQLRSKTEKGVKNNLEPED